MAQWSFVSSREDDPNRGFYKTFPMMDAEGRRLNGKVMAIEGDAVQMDFNHPMAGNDLFFKGEVCEVREATAEELSHGHTHAEDGCSCGSDGSCEAQGSCNDDGGQGGCSCAS